MSTNHHPHLRPISIPPRLTSLSLSTSTPLPTPSKRRHLPTTTTTLLLSLLSLHSLFLLSPTITTAAASSLLPLAFLISLLSFLLHFRFPTISSSTSNLPRLLLNSLFFSLSLLLRLLSLRLLPSPSSSILADLAGSLAASSLSSRRLRPLIPISLATFYLAASSSAAILFPFAAGFLAFFIHRTRHARAATLALAAAILAVPAFVALATGASAAEPGSAAAAAAKFWWPVLNFVVFGVVLKESRGNDDRPAKSSVLGTRDLAVTFVCTVVLELVYFPKTSLLPGFLVSGLLLWLAARELSPSVGYVELGSIDSSESMYSAVVRPVRHILSERKSRKIAAFLLINTAYMVIEFMAGFMSNSLGLVSDACHMLFDCAALAIGLYASYIARLPANNVYNYGRGRFEVLSGYVNAVFLVLVGALIVLESCERILDPREISTNSLLAVSVGGLVVNIIGLVFFHEEHHHAHGGGTCSHSHSHSHGHSHSHVHHHGHEHHQHHDHPNVGHGGKECCEHHGDAHKNHHHHHHNHDQDDHHHECDLHKLGVEQHQCHGSEQSHNHNLHHAEAQVHQDCDKVNSEQGLLEIPLGSSHSHRSDVHSRNNIHGKKEDSSETGNHLHRSGNRHHIDHNMEGIFLHVLADTMGSVGVVISTLLIKYKGWLVADPICSVFISIMIVSSVLPLLRNSAEILLQRVPRTHENDVKIALDDVMKIKGVSAIHTIHVWSLTNTDIVGTFHLNVSAEADKVSVRERASEIFHEAGIKDLTIQIECVNR